MTDALARIATRVREQRYVAPLVVGLVLRVAWTVGAFRTQFSYLHPAVQNLRMARGFAARVAPQLGGDPSAFLPPGQPMLLAPLAWLVGLLDLELDVAVAATHVLVGTATILLGAVLVARAFGQRSGRAAAWLLAIAPGLIAVTPVATSHTVLMPLVFGALLLVLPVRPPTGLLSDGRIRAAVAGVLAGLAVLCEPASLVVVLPAVAVGLWSTRRRPSGARAWTWCLLGLAVVVAPWTVRNGVQVGVWSPLPTRLAATVCMGGMDVEAIRLNDDPVEAYPECHRSRLFRDDSLLGPRRTTPFDDLPEEAEWFGTTLGDAVGDRLGDPGGELTRGASKVYQSLRSGRGALDLVGDMGDRPVVSGRVQELLGRLLDAWQGVVAVLAVVAVVLVPRSRRGPVLVAVIGALVALVVGPLTEAPPLLLVALATLLVADLVGAVADDRARSADALADEPAELAS